MNELKKIAYNCRKATLLIEKKQLAKLTLREKMELNIHLTGCSVCKLFQQQSLLINRQIKRLLQSSMLEKRSLDEKYKKELQEKIEKKLTRP